MTALAQGEVCQNDKLTQMVPYGDVLSSSRKYEKIHLVPAKLRRKFRDEY